MNKEFTSDATKTKSDYCNFLYESNYKETFWENVDNQYILPISETVKAFIKNKFN